ncbi:ARM repeat superfamily protein [Artemisia annua]|uniref:ARM repeat superfamily protein n=1 Tax=Artemisia annua TaxID=35608 RepID=A0A2U1N8L2_ARTAN|nr:ARM repeat superfamily protein [Artemisia annua]
MEKRLRSSLTSSADEFLKSISKHPFRTIKPSLKSLIHSLKPDDVVSSLPISLHSHIALLITNFKHSNPVNSPPSTPPTKRARKSNRQDDTVSDQKNDNPKTELVENLQIYAYVALMCVTHPENVFGLKINDVLLSVQVLHDNLVLFENEAGLLSDIALLCEEWWRRDLVGKDGLISQMLPFLLSKALTMKKKVDVKRVYGMREAFALFDFEDESIEDLKLLLIRCLISPLFLKMDEGRKFLAFLFGLSRQLVKELLAMVRSQIAFGRKSMLEAYGEIVFRGWKGVDGELKEEIENEFLLQLVDGSIHASSGVFGASIRRVLGGFVSQRTVDGVEKVLYKLAEPVIFRSLQAANSNVRLNALHLLIDVFPLEDPDATREAKDTLLQKQFFLIEKLIVDDCPDIRAVAVEGSCRILHMFWEVIPSSVITKLITKILDDMAHDVSNMVRLSTVNGIIYLLGNPQSHEILKVLLPRLGHLILDSTLSIRSAILDLLLLLKGIHNFQFHKVVKLDVLLSALANDQSIVAQKITKLLQPSYFPTTVTPEEACNRCVTLIKRSPLAGARFCEFALSEGASPQFLNKLFKILINLALSPANLVKDQIDGILMAAANICNNLSAETKFKAAIKDELTTKKLVCLFSSANSGRAQASVCNIVATVHPEAAGALRQECMALVTRCTGLSDNKEKQVQVREVHKMMMSCGWIDYMLDEMTKLLRNTADGCVSKYATERTSHNSSSGKKRKAKHATKDSGKSKRTSGKKSADARSNFYEDYIVSVGIAWQLKDLLTHSNTQKAVLGCQSLESAFHALKVLSEFNIKECMQCDYINSLHVSAYTSLSLHMSVLSNNTNNHGSTRSSSELSWVEQTIDHLLQCTEKVYRKSASKKSCTETPRSIHAGNKHIEPYQEQKRISNMVKLSTSILKFIIDSSSVDRIRDDQERCLSFTRQYVEFVIVSLRQHSHGLLEFKEEDLKDTFLCLKSSFTYAAKLLNLVLTSSSESTPPSIEAHNLANDLFDLIISVEEHLGPRYGSLVLSAAKLWLPDLILALGSLKIHKSSSTTASSSSSAFAETTLGFPSWLLILAKIEIFDQQDSDVDDNNDEKVVLPSKYSTFRKVVEVMTKLLRVGANQSLLDAVGVFLLDGSMAGLNKKNFEMISGVLHFVCTKLVKHENVEWEDRKLMLESIRQMYPQMERTAEELRNGHEKELLERARMLVEPVWRCYIDVVTKEPMETGFSDS